MRLVVTWASKERRVMSRMVSRMAASHSISHFSTLPPAWAGLKLVFSSTFSPSSLYSAVTCSRA